MRRLRNDGRHYECYDKRYDEPYDERYDERHHRRHVRILSSNCIYIYISSLYVCFLFYIYI